VDEKIITLEDVVMVRWNYVTIDGIKRAEDLTKGVKRDVGRANYFAIVPSTAPLPDEPTRRRMGESLKLFLDICDTINLVFEGRGLKIAAARSVAASIFLIQGNRKMNMFSNIAEALDKQVPQRSATLKALALENGISVAD
jgi:hypothetical protein